MKNIKALLLLLFFTFFSTNAQILNPVKWQSTIEKKSNTEYLVTFEGDIEKDWHLYSQFTPEGGPAPLELLIPNSKGNYQIEGKATESETTTKFNDVFGIDETFFEGKVKIRQLIKVSNLESPILQIELSYQVCKQVCVQQNNYFEFDLQHLNSKEVKNFSKAPKHDVVINAQKRTPVNEKGLLSIFFIAFFSGFAALLTPCVFPLIPMTVSFFTKQSKTRAKGIKNAIVYGVSIISIYVFLGTVITVIFGSDALNALSTNVWFNVIFFILLVVFAASFLGAFEIILPNSLANRVDRQADKGGVVGILFMALALAIVSFSCTGPIVGTLLVEAASKGGPAPIVGMLGFSSALALPFMLFALFPGWLNSLPKSGSWLNTVKVVLGFLELALAFKFLSNADLVLQLHWLERETFLAIWIVIFGALGLYLLGKITLPHDDALPRISIGRLGLALVVISFTVYMVPGLFGAPLKAISGFPPPLYYSESPYGVDGISISKRVSHLPEGAELGPHDIISFTDYQRGLAYAKSTNKPVLLNFTGYACVNCRKMEDNVWSDPAILSILKNEVVLISLHVDDKRPLAEKDQYISKETGKSITTLGNKWSDFQITRYKTNAQPYYIVIDVEGKDLNLATGYTPDVSEYKEWLESGISNQ